MTQFLSGRQRNLKVGISSFSENTTSLQVTGNVGIGTTFAGSSLYVIGDGAFTGVVTAVTFIGNLTGTATYATNAGISTYATSSGIATYATSSGIATYATNAGISTYATSSGIATYATNAGISTYATSSGIATALQNSRTFEITGDIVASAISFNGTGNVSLAATIQPNSVALGSDTTGDYVQSISGTSNQITVTSGTGEGSTPILSLPSNLVIPQDATVTRDLQVNRNLNVTGNITIGGTSAAIFAQELKISDPDIVLGFRTDAFGNDISNDTTSNHGGVALASTEGTPLVDLFIAGIETNLSTYKKIMWFRAGTFAGLGTDAWLINYGVGIGSTQFPTGTRLAAGNVQFTQNDLAVVRNINASGVVTATSGNITTLSGNNVYYNTGIVTTLSGTNINYSGISTFGSVLINAGIISATSPSGIVTYYGDGSKLTGINAASIVGVTSFATSSGIATNLKGGLAGNIPYQSAPDTTVFLTNGGSGTVLQSNGVGNAPTWVAAAPAGAVTGITIRDSTNTIVGTSGSVTQLTFGSGLSVTGTTGVAGIATIILSSNIVGTSLSISGISTLGVTSTTNLTSQQLNVSGISTFTNGPVLIGSGTSTGTASQRLQVTGGAYVSGSVGIGTTNPGYIIDAGGAGQNVPTINCFGPSVDNNWAGGIRFASNNNTTVTSQIQASTSGLLFSYGGIERFRINSSGNLGIGTASPTYKLESISSSSQLHAGPDANTGLFVNTTDATFSRSFRIDNSVGAITAYVFNNSQKLGLSVTSTGDPSLYQTDSTKTFNLSSAGLLTLSSNSAERVRLDLSGNVLVGTATSTGTASQALQVNSGAYVSGSVGIGTTNPGSKLTVNGAIQIQQDSGSNNRFILRGQSASLYRWNVDNFGSANDFRIFREDDATAANGSVAVSISTIGTLTATKFSGDGSLLTNLPTSSQWVTTSVGIHTLSNVGIGTTNPTSRLTVSGNASITGILTADQVYTSNNGTGQNVRIGDDLWIGDINVSNTTRFSGAQDSTKAFIIFGSSDTVALGRTGTGPLYYGGDFTISGVSTANSFRARGGAPGALGVNNNGYGFFSPGDSDSGMYSSADGQIEFYTNSNEAVRINSSQNVGIGTTLPTSKLHVVGNANITGVTTASQFSTGASGTGINIDTNTISGPSILYIDPSAVGDNTGAVRIKGDFYVDGTQFVVNSSTIELADLRVGIATTVGTNLLLDGGGIGIGSANILKTITWNNAASALTSSEDWNLVSGKQYEINGTSVLNATTLGSAVVNSSLTTVGTLGQLNVSGISTFQGQIQSTRANSTADGGGQIYLNGATGNRIDFNTNGVAAPAFTTRSVGTKIVLFPRIDASNVDFAFGIDAGTLWSSVGDSINQFKWYAATTNIATLFGTGELVLGTTSKTGTATQRLQVTGSAYVSGSVGIGTTNPTSKLHVVGDATITNPDNTALAVRSGATVSFANFNIGRTTNEASISVAGAGGQFANNASAGDAVIRTDSVGAKLIFTNGASNSTLAVAGNNVLVGTISSTGTASQPLQVTGGAYVSGNLGVGVTNPGANANGTLQVNGTIGLAPNSQIRQWTNSNSGTLQIFATQFVGGLNNGDSYGYSGGGIIAAVSNSDAALLLDIGRGSSSPLGRFKIANTIGGNISLSFANGSSTTLYTDTGSGNVGINTTNPTSKLHVVGNAYITGVTTSTDFDSLSDINLKTNINKIPDPLEKVMQIRGVTFDWKETQRSSAGVIAQEIEKVLPELVHGDETKTVNYNGLIGLLIECVKKQQEEIDELKKRL